MYKDFGFGFSCEGFGFSCEAITEESLMAFICSAVPDQKMRNFCLDVYEIEGRSDAAKAEVIATVLNRSYDGSYCPVVRSSGGLVFSQWSHGEPRMPEEALSNLILWFFRKEEIVFGEVYDSGLTVQDEYGDERPALELRPR